MKKTFKILLIVLIFILLIADIFILFFKPNVKPQKSGEQIIDGFKIDPNTIGAPGYVPNPAETGEYEILPFEEVSLDSGAEPKIDLVPVVEKKALTESEKEADLPELKKGFRVNQ